MIKWDLKSRSCFYYHTLEPVKGTRAIYIIDTGTVKTGREVETYSKDFLEAILNCGKTRAEQAGEDNLGVHQQLLLHAHNWDVGLATSFFISCHPIGELNTKIIPALRSLTMPLRLE
jgi:hypothetical protein